MQLGKSDILNLIYAEAENLRKKYRSSNISQNHILCALLDCSLRGEEEIKNHAEITDALEFLFIPSEKLGEQLSATLAELKRNPITTYEDVTALEDCYELAEIGASLTGKKQVTLPMLIQKIVDNPTEKTDKLFTFTPKPTAAPPVSAFGNDLDELLGEDVKKAENPPRKYITNKPPRTTSKGYDRHLEAAMDGDPISLDEQTLSDIVAPIKHMQARLRKHVYGQDEAIFAVVSGYFNALARQSDLNSTSAPRATFLFAGAPGVGKTYLAQVAARALHLPFRRFDMSSFSDKEAPLEFSGTDKVYRNAHEGLVTGFVKKHPKCVLLFDEIEKAHINIIHLFLQILDAGRLKDACTGENVSFKDAVIIMTTNAGKSLYDNLEPGAPMPNRKVIINTLANEVNPNTRTKFFPEAICSRFAAGNVVLFNPLGAQELLNIGRSCLEDYAADFEQNFRIRLTFDDHLCAALLYAEGGRVDARALKGRASNFISSEVYNWIRFAYEKDDIRLSEIKEIRLKTDIGSGDTAKLFMPQAKPTILLYSDKPDTYAHIVSDDYRILRPATKQEADALVTTEEIDLAICDILGDEAPTLNIEDTTSDGRRLMDTLIKERIPVYVYSATDRAINSEERQALSENGASGIFEQVDCETSLNALKVICKRVHSEKKLHELGRARKVLSFDCNYDMDGKDIGVINLTNMRINPAIDAQDQTDIAGLCATDTTFDSIIGAEDAKAELKGFISYLKDPRAYAKNGIPAPKGLILYGPPGTGKTMLAKALAHESGATFIATQGNNFLTGITGGGAHEVKRLFSLARKYAPTVLFIDEIDIVAKDRMTGSIGNDVVNALLNEMDGFATNTARPVFVLAATNFDVSFGRQSALDPALLRRFDRRIFVDLPDRQERLKFIRERLARSNQTLSDEMIQNVALRSTEMSLAELESVIDFALRGMLQRGHTALTDALFDEAFETYRYGEKTAWDEELLHRVAVHESGHAIISYLSGSIPSYITVSGRSNFGGYMYSENTHSVQTKQRLLNSIRVALGGRAAEIVLFGEEDGISTGAASDLRSASAIAKQMVSVYGMSDERGLMVEDTVSADEETVRLCNHILKDELDNAVAQLTEHRDKLEALVEAVVNKNHLLGEEITQILAK